MADEKAPEKAPKPVIELGDADVPATAAAASASGARPGPAEGRPEADAAADAARAPDAGAGGEGVRTVASRIAGWVSRTFPGHEKAFWGGVCGLLCALAFFAIGLWRTLVVVALVTAGVAAGQVLDGDPRIVDALRRLLSRNQ